MQQPPNYFSFKFSQCLLGAQTLFIAMGALVLVPLLTGMDPSVALFTAGSGTLIFQWLTYGQVPVFLGSSFAFVPPTVYAIQTWGLPATLCGLAASGIVYFLMSLVIMLKGRGFIDKLLPPLVTGPVIMGIGLILAPIAINLATGKSGDGTLVLYSESKATLVALLALTATILVRLFGHGKLKLIPILIGILVGYSAALCFGMVDFSSIRQASWLQWPNFVLPKWHWQPILLMMPIAAVSAIEHIGDIAAISAITQRNYMRYPGVHRTLMGDGLATMWASLLGGPPNTTYSEVSAGVALTQVFNPGIMTWSAITAIILAFVGKVGAFLQTIPEPVMGGILILLFGAITVTGMNLLVQAKQDLMQPRAMTIAGIILVLTLGGMSIGQGEFSISGIGLGGVIGVLLNLLLPHPKARSAALS
jgi:uracil permease